MKRTKRHGLKQDRGVTTTAPSFDTPDLLWRLATRVRQEEAAGLKTGHGRLFRDALVAERAVVTRRLALLTEEMRTQDMGVTITSLSQARCLPGLSWWEWDARIAGRAAPAVGDLDCDRTGVLINAHEDGRRGTMHVVAGARVGGQLVAEILPLACNFDWREAYDPPHSLLTPASVADVRKFIADVTKPTLVEQHASPEVIAAVSRRFGVVESSYIATEIALQMGGGTTGWLEQAPGLTGSLVADTMQEAAFMLMLCIILLSAPVVVTNVARGARLPTAAWGSHALLDYTVLDIPEALDAVAHDGRLCR